MLTGILTGDRAVDCRTYRRLIADEQYYLRLKRQYTDEGDRERMDQRAAVLRAQAAMLHTVLHGGVA